MIVPWEPISSSYREGTSLQGRSTFVDTLGLFPHRVEPTVPPDPPNRRKVIYVCLVLQNPRANGFNNHHFLGMWERWDWFLLQNPGQEMCWAVHDFQARVLVQISKVGREGVRMPIGYLPSLFLSSNWTSIACQNVPLLPGDLKSVWPPKTPGKTHTILHFQEAGQCPWQRTPQLPSLSLQCENRGWRLESLLHKPGREQPSSSPAPCPSYIQEIMFDCPWCQTLF